MNIGIVGLGLIGGSLGLDLRALGHSVWGVSRQAHTCERAIARGAADHASTDLAILKAAEVIFICTPIAAIAPTVQQLIPHLQPGTILTDVGSVKQAVVEAIAPLWPHFVGGHPMAGNTTAGIEAAESQLFVNRPYVLTPVDSTPTEDVAVLEGLVRSLGAKLYHCTPAAHDRSVAWISHLPVVVSASLIAACLAEPDLSVQKLAQQLASSGFRDTSRVGGGNSELGVMMARYNQTALLRSLHTYRQTLDRLIEQIEQSDWAALEQELQQTHQARSLYVETE